MLVNCPRRLPRAARGATLIELCIAMAIAVMLIVIAVPGYTTWVADGQIRAGAESIVTGMRFAYAEAIKRNQQVEFVLVPTTGTGLWTARTVTGTVVERGYFSEAAKLAAFGTAPAGATTVTFTGLGAINATNADASPVLTQVDVTHSNGAIANTRPLRILVGGGRTGIKLCDPAVADTTSPRYCTT